MLRIFHVSDLHLNAAPARNAAALALLGRIHERFDPATDHLLVTGDIVDDGSGPQYEQAVRALSPFRGRLLVTLGNHDACLIGNIYSGDRARRFEDELLAPLGIAHRPLNKVPMVDEISDGKGAQLLAIGLNSVKQTEAIHDFAEGAIGRAQLAALEAHLVDPRYEGWWRLVYLHHRPYKYKFLHVGMHLDDADDLLKVVTNRVHTMAFGHSGGCDRGGARRSLPEEMETVPRELGIPYMLNANASVSRQQCFLVTIDGRPEAAIKTELLTFH